jgi:AraC-like DNA-binding protein
LTIADIFLTIADMGRATVSANVLTGFAGLVRSHGADPARLLRQARIAPAALGDAQARLPVRAVARLLEDTAQALALPDLGLRLSQARRLSHFGAVGQLARDEPDVRHALLAITSWLHLHSEVILELHEERATANLSAHLAETTGATSIQVNDLVVGGIFQILRHLLGPAWRPQAVALVHGAPAEARRYAHYFGCRVEFDAEANALFLAAADLDRPLAEADPLFRSASERQVEEWAGLHAKPLADQVRELIRVLLPSGRCGMETVALRLGLQSRTLRRHLAAAGVSFAEELERTRRELAQRYLATSAKPIASVGALLGFSEASAFSRWFAQGFGCSPSQWRTGGARERRGLPIARRAAAPGRRLT